MGRGIRTVLLTTEGTYPFQRGGVSTWCDVLVRQMPDVRYLVFAVAMNPYVTLSYELPGSVRGLITVPLWGTQDPSEHRGDLPFSEIFLRKQRTTADVVERVFYPLFVRLVDVLVSPTEDPRAFGELLHELYRYFLIYDYEASFKAPGPWGYFKERVVGATLRGQWDEPSVFDLVQALGWIYRFLVILNTPIPAVDLVHSSAAAFCGLVGIVAKLQHGVPYLLTEHGVYLREQYLSVGRSNMAPFAKGFLLSLIRRVVSANLYFADEIAPVCAFNGRWERELGAAPHKIRVVYNGVSPQVFNPESERRLAEPGGRLLVVSVARMDPNKDVETLLRAAALVHERLPEVAFRVQGAISVPDYHQRMLALRRELGLDSVVEFREHSAQVVDIYREADIVVQSSVSEAFPYAVIEAMMMAKPVVATEVGGTAEALADNGLLVPARDPERLAEAIGTLARQPALRTQLGEAARERALSMFTIQRTIREFDATYRRLMGRGQAAGALRRGQKLALARAFALAGIGEVDAALVQMESVLAQDPGGIMAPVLLAQMAAWEGARGRQRRQIFHLVRARLLEDLRVAN